MNELLPCPFCGGEAHVFKLHDWWVSHGCEVLGKYLDTHSFDTEAEAVAAWNTRYERTCKMESVWGTNALQCSECCSYVSTWDAECEIGKINYCPNCGAKVVG